MDYQRQFLVGKTYLTKEGKKVKIIAENTTMGPAYTCVQGDDGQDRIVEDWRHPGIYDIISGSTLGWRYDRCDDAGRVTASSFNDPRNLVPGSCQDA